jgi:hypothetical protein
MPKKTKPREKPAFVIRTFSLMPADNRILRGLSQDATDALGRTISESAIVRALLRLAKQQQLASQLVTLVEAELNAGVRWGKQK